MLEGPLAEGQRQHFAVGDLTRQWIGGIGLAAVVGLGYFLAAAFSVRLVLEPEGVAVFWPAAGLSSGLLIALGLRARWPVLAGVIVATVATHLIIRDPPLGGHRLGPMQRGRSPSHSRIDPALLRCGFQPRWAAPNHCTARCRSRRDECVWDRGCSYLQFVARAIGADA
jgi:hypothetical protein